MYLDPSQPQGTQGGYYVDQKPYDSRGTTPLNIILDGSRPEQRIPLQVIVCDKFIFVCCVYIFFSIYQNVQPQSVVWGRTDGSALPPNVFQEGNDLVFRSPSAEQAGNYICTITNPDGSVDHINVYVDYRQGDIFFLKKIFFFFMIIFQVKLVMVLIQYLVHQVHYQFNKVQVN